MSREIPLKVFALLFVIVVGCASQKTEADGKTESDSGEKQVTAKKANPKFLRKEGEKNALAKETSPYLLMHAKNPVNWYAWGPEAFEKAKKENKPIFLSIGYSSCYWCHVMERLVFEDKDIAAYMNEHFVNIKVDREERPDVDEIYMNSLLAFFQMLGVRQGGGWPLSMFLTPQGKPFTGGTYFPPEDDPKSGRVGFPRVLQGVVSLWDTRKEDVEHNAEVLTQQVRRMSKPTLALTPTPLERELSTKAATELAGTYDSEYGGIDFNSANPNAPKFPTPAKLSLLQYELARIDDKTISKVLYHTLDEIAAGGIRDHLGGGFHRYSTDRYWKVPHFEKMLYDQAQLAHVYVEAYRQTKNERYREVAEEVLNFVLREMTGPEGGFYSALDAETEHIEGKFYVWSEAEVKSVLGEEEAKLFAAAYGMDQPNDFEHGFVLHLPRPLTKLAVEVNLPIKELKAQLAESRRKLLAARNKRVKPLLDDKILTSWNGLMIRAFAHAGMVFNRRDYLEAGERAARFVLTNMRDEKGRLHRTFRSKQAKLNAYLDDYAFLTQGLVALYQGTGDEKWLNAAQRLTDDQIAMFWDPKNEGFYFTPDHHEELIARTKNAYDSVLPSGNSVSVRNLLRIASMSDTNTYREKANEVLDLFAPALKRAPRGMTNMALALGEYLDEKDYKLPPMGERNNSATPIGYTQKVPGVIKQTVNKVPQDEPKKKPQLVKGRAYFSVDKLPPGKTCQVLIYLAIDPKWHINANPSQPKFLVPTTFQIKSKLGTKLSKVAYPKGKEFMIEGFDEPALVYEKNVPIRGLVQVPANIAGQMEELELIINYQACDDMKCLQPTKIVLKGKLKVADKPEDVKQINSNLFPKPKS